MLVKMLMNYIVLFVKPFKGQQNTQFKGGEVEVKRKLYHGE